jgi:hypothetical protein
MSQERVEEIRSHRRYAHFPLVTTNRTGTSHHPIKASEIVVSKTLITEIVRETALYDRYKSCHNRLPIVSAGNISDRHLKAVAHKCTAPQF